MSQVQVKRFTDTGIAAVREWLVLAKRSGTPDLSRLQAILGSDLFASCLDSAPFHIRRYVTRYELAQAVARSLGRELMERYELDTGLWSWMALALFEHICPRKGNRLNIGKLYRWIADTTNYRTYYRHLVAGPSRVLLAHWDCPDDAIVLLAGRERLAGSIRVVLGPSNNEIQAR